MASSNAGEPNVQKNAHQFIADFRRGEDFHSDSPVAGLISDRRVGHSTLSVLTIELAVGTPQNRLKVVKLLEKIGLELDLPVPAKFPIIRDHAIIRALAVEGFAKDDGVADEAASILRRQCLPSDLAAISNVYIGSLEQSDGDYLYLVAKAKVTQALPYVERMAQSPEWNEDKEDFQIVRIAQAALGNLVVEDAFIQDTIDAAKSPPAAPKNRFYDVGDAKDGAEIASRLQLLGYIGTKRSLGITCGFLRSPIKSYVRNVRERSIRYDAIDAIRYNFPDERLLYHPRTTAEWAAAERFCTDNLGVIFDGPTPILPADRIYPSGAVHLPKK